VTPDRAAGLAVIHSVIGCAYNSTYCGGSECLGGLRALSASDRTSCSVCVRVFDYHLKCAQLVVTRLR
jgi:predicted transcriptional regulator of viral defense system